MSAAPVPADESAQLAIIGRTLFTLGQENPAALREYLAPLDDWGRAKAAEAIAIANREMAGFDAEQDDLRSGRASLSEVLDTMATRLRAGQLNLAEVDPDELSGAERTALLDRAARTEWLASLPPEQVRALPWDWNFWGRPTQLWPRPDEAGDAGDWRFLLIRAGRGAGKTRTGAELTRQRAKDPTSMVFIGATPADVRDLMIEGDSGILAITPPGERPMYEPSKRLLTWPNGTIAYIRSAADPDDVRGLNVSWAWLDELAKWRYLAETWSNLRFAMRKGDNPQTVVTTTPKPLQLLRDLSNHRFRGTVVRTESTYRNAAHLAPAALEEYREVYEGTRLGAQELHAEILEEAEGALWSFEMIEADRLLGYLEDGEWVKPPLPEFRRRIVAVDPSLASTGGECGIVVAALGLNGHGYILDDRSLRAKPSVWAEAVMAAYRDWDADALVVETNLPGREAVEDVLKALPDYHRVRFVEVKAHVGKDARAEPVVGRYEKHLVHHVGTFAELEMQLCLPAGVSVITARGDVPVEQVRAGDLVATRHGWAPVEWAGQTGTASELVSVTHTHGVLQLTPCHPMFDTDRGSFVTASDVATGLRLAVSDRPPSTGSQSHGGAPGGHAWQPGTSEGSKTGDGFFSTAPSGLPTTAPSQTGCTSITSTATRVTTGSPISPSSPPASTSPNMNREGSRSWPQNDGGRSRSSSGNHGPARTSPAPSAGSLSTVATCEPWPVRTSAVESVRTVTSASGIPVPVYNLKVADGYLPEFFANGVLVHNCNWVPGGGQPSPDRLDALVWAITELLVRFGGPTRVRIPDRPVVKPPIIRRGPSSSRVVMPSRLR